MPGSTWTASQLNELADAEELVLLISRVDRSTLRFPVWPVVVDGNPYVRSYLGVTTGWYRAVVANPRQAVVLDGRDVDVLFEFVSRTDSVNRGIDSAFLGKYARFQYRDAMVEPGAVDATLRIVRA
ncbi:MAG TPA: DUF2255 family protein [Galbitalea sp.]|nr:DUF2255 family protein [Galbitalea sp.]